MIGCRRVALALAGLLLGLGTVAGVRAASQPSYVDSVDQALQVLRQAPGDDRAAAFRAADILEAGTGQSQREILTELRQDPPDVADARTRLAALSRAAHAPAFVPEPTRARQAVHDILAQPRYASLNQQPTLLDRLRDAFLRLVVWVLDRIGSAAGGFGIGFLVFGLVGAAALLLIGVVIVRSVRWRGRGEARLAGPTGGAGPASEDRFARADRLAAAGDLAGAVRALAGAVAEALGGERAWDVSPLTVRELYARASDPAALRPLLRAFEAAVYGERPPDPDAYRLAAAAAAPYRPERRRAA